MTQTPTEPATEEYTRGWRDGYARAFAEAGHGYGSDYAEGYKAGLAQWRQQREFDFETDAWPSAPAPRDHAPETPGTCESCT